MKSTQSFWERRQILYYHVPIAIAQGLGFENLNGSFSPELLNANLEKLLGQDHRKGFSLPHCLRLCNSKERDLCRTTNEMKMPDVKAVKVFEDIKVLNEVLENPGLLIPLTTPKTAPTKFEVVQESLKSGAVTVKTRWSELRITSCSDHELISGEKNRISREEFNENAREACFADDSRMIIFQDFSLRSNYAPSKAGLVRKVLKEKKKPVMVGMRIEGFFSCVLIVQADNKALYTKKWGSTEEGDGYVPIKFGYFNENAVEAYFFDNKSPSSKINYSEIQATQPIERPHPQKLEEVKPVVRERMQSENFMRAESLHTERRRRLLKILQRQPRPLQIHRRQRRSLQRHERQREPPQILQRQREPLWRHERQRRPLQILQRQLEPFQVLQRQRGPFRVLQGQREPSQILQGLHEPIWIHEHQGRPFQILQGQREPLWTHVATSETRENNIYYDSVIFKKSEGLGYSLSSANALEYPELVLNSNFILSEAELTKSLEKNANINVGAAYPSGLQLTGVVGLTSGVTRRILYKRSEDNKPILVSSAQDANLTNPTNKKFWGLMVINQTQNTLLIPKLTALSLHTMVGHVIIEHKFSKRDFLFPFWDHSKKEIFNDLCSNKRRLKRIARQLGDTAENEYQIKSRELLAFEEWPGDETCQGFLFCLKFIGAEAKKLFCGLVRAKSKEDEERLILEFGKMV